MFRENLERFLIYLGHVQNEETAGNLIVCFTHALANFKHDKALNAKLCEELLERCRSDDLLLVAKTLNCFFDIWPDVDYNEVLKEANVIP